LRTETITSPIGAPFSATTRPRIAASVPWAGAGYQARRVRQARHTARLVRRTNDGFEPLIGNARLGGRGTLRRRIYTLCGIFGNAWKRYGMAVIQARSDSFATMTSVDLMIASTSSPFARPSRSAEDRVMIATRS